mmetsp:Transcript_9633/g.17034  ORF Transcript_9633/g.17034 Transcript_9633/m.17034 type:complete len:128 (-) Transcript_9633:437-820(-)
MLMLARASPVTRTYVHRQNSLAARPQRKIAFNRAPRSLPGQQDLQPEPSQPLPASSQPSIPGLTEPAPTQTESAEPQTLLEKYTAFTTAVGKHRRVITVAVAVADVAFAVFVLKTGKGFWEGMHGPV